MDELNNNKNKSVRIENPSNKIKIEMTYNDAKELLERPESNQCIVLQDGKRVGVTMAGDPNGIPAIIMFGMGMHSRTYALLLNNYGIKHKVKVIGFDRPDIDLSDSIYYEDVKVYDNHHSKNSTINISCSSSSSKCSCNSSCSSPNLKDRSNIKKNSEKEETSDGSGGVIKRHKKKVDLQMYAEWVEAIVDKLKIEKFYIISQCVGSLYALGCVQYFKHKEKIASPLYLIAPWVDPKQCAFPIRWIYTLLPLGLIRWGMSCYYRWIGLLVPSAAKSPNAFMFRSMGVGLKDDPLGGRRLLFSKVLKSGFFRNQTKHFVHDDWELGFCVNPQKNRLDFSQLSTDIVIYHGDHDGLIPIKSSQNLIKQWSSHNQAQLIIKKGSDHQTIKGSCFNDIFYNISLTIEKDQEKLEQKEKN